MIEVVNISKKYQKMPVILNILGQLDSGSKITLTLINSEEKTVREKIITPEMLDGNLYIDISDIPAGSYTIAVNSPELKPETKQFEIIDKACPGNIIK